MRTTNNYRTLAHEIRTAAKKIAPYIHHTPVIYSNSFSSMFSADIFIKAENLQKTGSFKVRGALYKLMKHKAKTVIAASMGNHAQGVAYAAGMLGSSATIVMPRIASPVKVEATSGYGAQVILHGETIKDALAYAEKFTDDLFVHPYDDIDVIAGQGTIGLEILSEAKDLDAVVVPVGGGGLISGIAAIIKTISPKTKVFGVQARSAPSANRSLKKHRITEVTPLQTIADGIAVNRIGVLNFRIMNDLVDDILLVSENAIASAVLLFMERKKLVSEGAGAAGLAAVLEHRKLFRNKKVLLVVSGGNIDFTVVDSIVTKGLIAGGRIGRFRVIAEPGARCLYMIAELVNRNNGGIINISHDRFTYNEPAGRTVFEFTIETRGQCHFDGIIKAVAKAGFKILCERC